MTNMLQPEEAKEFRTVLTQSFKRYGMDHVDLADHKCTPKLAAKERDE